MIGDLNRGMGGGGVDWIDFGDASCLYLLIDVERLVWNGYCWIIADFK